MYTTQLNSVKLEASQYFKGVPMVCNALVCGFIIIAKIDPPPHINVLEGFLLQDIASERVAESEHHDGVGV